MQEAHPTISCEVRRECIITSILTLHKKKTMKSWITLLAQNAGMLKAGGGNQTADAKTLNWILMNTKDCPHCGVSVQKNQGAISGVRKSKSY